MRMEKFIEWFKSAKIQKVFQIFWIGLAFIFLTSYISKNWQAFATQSWQISWTNLALAMFFALLRKFLGGVQWGLISSYRRENQKIATFAEDLRVYFVSNLAIYIPGSIWLITSRIQLNNKRGVSALSTSTSMIYETGLFVWSSCLVGSYIAVQIFPDRARGIVVAILLLVVFSLVIIHPSVVRTVMNSLGKLIKTDRLFVEVTYLDGLFLFVVAILLVTVGGVSHFFLVRTFYDGLTFISMPAITSAFALGWTIGYLTPIAPSGLGVRDVILVALFTMWMPGPIAVVVAVASRILFIIEDVVWAVVALFAPKNVFGK